MTGFGDASCETESVHYAVEVRSLNNRYFKATIRLPDEICGLEAELETHLRKRISRGSVTLTVGLKDRSAEAAYELNEPALQRYLSHLRHIEKQVADGGDGGVTLDLATLLGMPGVIQPPESAELIERYRPTIHELLDQAVDKLTEMRRHEGEGLQKDLLSQREAIAERLDKIIARAPEVVGEYENRLRSRINELVARLELPANEADLVKEVAVFAERADVAEETQRLKAHMDQFEQILSSEDQSPSGRTLDFLAQEMLREANTIASKSNDAAISRWIVEVKGAIDRIKEQVQNVE